MINRIEFNAYDSAVEVNDNGSMTGYAVIWNVVDNKRDIHYANAYTRAVNNFVPGSIKLLPNHDQSDPIGYVTSLEIDEVGLKFSADFVSTDTAQKYRTLIAEGAIDKVSMGWAAMKSRPNSHGGRDILEVKLFEISPVAVPVGEETKILEVNNMEIETPDILDRFYGLVKNIGDKKLKLANQAELLKLADEYRKATHSAEATDPEVDQQPAQDQSLIDLDNALDQYLKED